MPTGQNIPKEERFVEFGKRFYFRLTKSLPDTAWYTASTPGKCSRSWSFSLHVSHSPIDSSSWSKSVGSSPIFEYMSFAATRMSTDAAKNGLKRKKLKRPSMLKNPWAMLYMHSIHVLYRVGAPLGAVLGPCSVAVVGTREPTREGRRLAREVGRRLAARGYTVITGLAYGVDEEAALGALEARGRTVAVLPYLFEDDATLNPRATWLLRIAAERNASASVVAENLVKDEGRVRAWLAMRNKVIIQLAKALVVPEARFRSHWGTRYAVEYALAAGRPVVVLEPRVKDGDVAKAFEYFRQRGAVAVKDVGEAIRII